MTEFANAPQTVTIAPGDQVRWVNNGAMDHNARSGTDPVEDGAWGSPDVAPGSSWSMTFTTSGTYDYFCSLHPLLMSGTVIVAP
jgi:plastocyanin